MAMAVCAPLIRSSRPRNASGASGATAGASVYLDISTASYIVYQRPPLFPYRGSSSYTLSDAPANERESPARKTARRTLFHGTSERQ